MKNALLPLALMAVAACASPGSSEDLKWSVDCPASVGRGALFAFTVRAARPGGAEVPGVAYRFHILWAGGGAESLPHPGASGAVQNLHARMTPGTASLVISGAGPDGQERPLARTSFEVH
jgi:hypothetical protein